jgi:hypothetical protein
MEYIKTMFSTFVHNKLILHVACYLLLIILIYSVTGRFAAILGDNMGTIGWFRLVDLCLCFPFVMGHDCYHLITWSFWFILPKILTLINFLF